MINVVTDLERTYVKRGCCKNCREKQYQFPKEYFEDFLNYHQITKQSIIKLKTNGEIKIFGQKKMESGNC